MDLERQDANVYELVTQLVKHTLRRNCPKNGNFYTPPRDDVKIVKKLRSKAFEILLNKSIKVHDEGTLTHAHVWCNVRHFENR